MGLDTSHGAFSGAYSAFDRFRAAVAKAAGVHWPRGFDNDYDIGFPEGFKKSNPGLYEFFRHSDCDGYIAPKTCASLAAEMEALLPKLDEQDGAWGHIARAGGFSEVAKQFIRGCREAARKKQKLEFM